MGLKYTKETPRITVKFINSDTEETICEVKDKTWMTVGELFPSSTVTSIIMNEIKNQKKLPRTVMVLAVAEYDLTDDE